MVGVQDRDTKWSSHETVVKMISQAETYLRLTVVTPIKPWAKYKHSFCDDSQAKDQASTTSASSSSSSTSSSNIIRVFTPSSSRTSFSSMSSTSSKESESCGREKQRKKSWSVLQIKSYK